MEPVKPGGSSGIFAGNGKWYAIGAVVAVGVILYIRSRGSSSSSGSSGATSTDAPSTDAQNQLNAIGDSLTGLQTSLANAGIIGNGTGLATGTSQPVSSTNAGSTQPAASITGFAASAYPSILGRPVESQSVADYWSGQGNVTQQYLGISGSAEGLSHAEAMPTNQYIQSQYALFGLGSPDAAAINFWQNDITKNSQTGGSTNAGYLQEQKDFAQSASQNPASPNYQQPVKK